MMYQYSPVPGLFIPVGDDGAAVQAALDKARAAVDESVWKRGNSQKTPGGVTELALKELAAIGYKAPDLTGKLKEVSYAETADRSGNTYRKLRLVLEANEPIRLSLDLDTELAQGLIQKLQHVPYGATITVGAFQVAAERNGRSFVNHKATVKMDGSEIRVSGFWKVAQDEAAAAAAALATLGITDKATVNKAKAGKVVEAHVRLLNEVQARLAAEAATAAESAPAPDAPAAPPAEDDDI